MKDPTGVAALYLGKQEGKDLVYMGKVGTGWSRTVSSRIRKQLDTVVSPKSKLTKPVKKPRKAAAGQKEMLMPISGPQRAKDVTAKTVAAKSVSVKTVAAKKTGGKAQRKSA